MRADKKTVGGDDGIARRVAHRADAVGLDIDDALGDAGRAVLGQQPLDDLLGLGMVAFAEVLGGPRAGWAFGYKRRRMSPNKARVDLCNA